MPGSGGTAHTLEKGPSACYTAGYADNLGEQTRHSLSLSVAANRAFKRVPGKKIKGNQKKKRKEEEASGLR